MMYSINIGRCGHIRSPFDPLRLPSTVLEGSSSQSASFLQLSQSPAVLIFSKVHVVIPRSQIDYPTRLTIDCVQPAVLKDHSCIVPISRLMMRYTSQ